MISLTSWSSLCLFSLACLVFLNRIASGKYHPPASQGALISDMAILEIADYWIALPAGSTLVAAVVQAARKLSLTR